MTKKRRQGEARRTEIIEGMMLALAEGGYEGATMQRIAQLAGGLTPGLIHYHFEHKRGLLLATLEELAARMVARYEAALAFASAEVKAEAEVMAWIEAHVSYEGADPLALASWVAIVAQAAHDEEVREALRGVIGRDEARLMASVRRALLEGGAPEQPEERLSREAQELSALIFAAVQGLYAMARVSPELLPAQFASRQLGAAARAMISGGVVRLTQRTAVTGSGDDASAS